MLYIWIPELSNTVTREYPRSQYFVYLRSQSVANADQILACWKGLGGRSTASTPITHTASPSCATFLPKDWHEFLAKWLAPTWRGKSRMLHVIGYLSSSLSTSCSVGFCVLPDRCSVLFLLLWDLERWHRRWILSRCLYTGTPSPGRASGIVIAVVAKRHLPSP